MAYGVCCMIDKRVDIPAAGAEAHNAAVHSRQTLESWSNCKERSDSQQHNYCCSCGV